VGSTDFYRKHALARLEGADPAPGPAGPAGPAGSAGPAARQPWPEDPALTRAKWLTDLGLDALALAEIEGLEALRDLDPRAVEALTGLGLARQGMSRAAIPHLRRAFPVLGGPHQETAPIEAQHLYYPVGFSAAVDAAAESAGLPHHLVYGMIREESAFDVTALSHAGARGLMQLMPATGREVARRLGLPFSNARLEEPELNIRLGAAYFARVLEMFDGETELALAGYNGGPYRLKRLWRQAGPEAEIDYFTEALPIEESKGYVKRVILFANSYRALYGV
jgi:soluble lytic murein transglycosylase